MEFRQFRITAHTETEVIKLITDKWAGWEIVKVKRSPVLFIQNIPWWEVLIKRECKNEI